MHIVDGIMTGVCVLIGLFIVLVIVAWWKDGHQ